MFSPKDIVGSRAALDILFANAEIIIFVADPSQEKYNIPLAGSGFRSLFSSMTINVHWLSEDHATINWENISSCGKEMRYFIGTVSFDRKRQKWIWALPNLNEKGEV